MRSGGPGAGPGWEQQKPGLGEGREAREARGEGSSRGRHWPPATGGRSQGAKYRNKRPARPAPAAHTSIEGSGAAGTQAAARPPARSPAARRPPPPARSLLRAAGRTPRPSPRPRPRAEKVCAASAGQSGGRARGAPPRPARPRPARGELPEPRRRRRARARAPRPPPAMGAAARSLRLALGLLLLLGTLLRPADACSCSPVHPQQAFCNADVGKDRDPAPARCPPPPRAARDPRGFAGAPPARPHLAEGPSARLLGLGAF